MLNMGEGDIIAYGLTVTEPRKKHAEKHQSETYIWDDEVEDYLLKLSNPKHYRDEVVGYGYIRGEEPYKYVREIFTRYDHYNLFISM